MRSEKDILEEEEEILLTEDDEGEKKPLVSGLIYSFILTLMYMGITVSVGFLWSIFSGVPMGESTGDSPVFVRAISRGIILLVCFFLYKKNDRRDFAPAMRALPVAVLLGLSMQIFASFLINPSVFRGGGQLGAAISSSELFPALLLSVSLSPVCEEILFRGLIYGELKRCAGGRRGVPAVICSLLFALVHSPVQMMAVAFFAGLVFAFLRDRTDSVIPCVLAHSAFNLMSYFSGYIPIGSPVGAVFVFALSAVFLIISIFVIAKFNVKK